MKRLGRFFKCFCKNKIAEGEALLERINCGQSDGIKEGFQALAILMVMIGLYVCTSGAVVLALMPTSVCLFWFEDCGETFGQIYLFASIWLTICFVISFVYVFVAGGSLLVLSKIGGWFWSNITLAWKESA